MDIFTEEKRSEIMSRIRSKWTKPERLAHSILKGNKIRHRMHPHIPGNPDIVITDNSAAIFIDGCFWHGCRRHFKMPESNRKYWSKKINANMSRDMRSRRMASAAGYKTRRIWECRLSSARLLAAAGAR